MNPAFKEFMHRLHPPARLTGEQTGWRLGLNRDEVRIISSPEIIQRVRESLSPKEQKLVLSSATRLRPLGNPSQPATKYFHEAEVARLEQDPAWLDKAARTIRLYWKLKKRSVQSSPNGNAKPQPDKNTHD